MARPKIINAQAVQKIQEAFEKGDIPAILSLLAVVKETLFDFSFGMQRLPRPKK